MKRLYKLYNENVYGVIGTLAFHILLIVSLLLADMTVKGETEHSFVSIEMGKDLLLSQLSQEEDHILQTESSTNEESANISSTESFRSSPVSNRAVNDAVVNNTGRTTNADPFFNEEYQKEIEAAQALVSNVNNQLAKNIQSDYKTSDGSFSDDLSGVSLNSGNSTGSRSSSGGNRFEMPEQTTDGLNPEEISNSIYSGKSNIHYSLENRYHKRLPIPVYLAHGGGKITIDIWVLRDGKVTKTEVQSSSAITDPMITEYALQAASRTVFNTDETAPNPQRGTITYTFVPQ